MLGKGGGTLKLELSGQVPRRTERPVRAAEPHQASQSRSGGRERASLWAEGLARFHLPPHSSGPPVGASLASGCHHLRANALGFVGFEVLGLCHVDAQRLNTLSRVAFQFFKSLAESLSPK